MQPALHGLLDAELARPAPDAVRELARGLAATAGTGCAAVIYYGSTLRADNLDGLLDFYVLLDDVAAWPATWAARLANRLLPPNVGYVERDIDGCRLRAKYALVSVAQFDRRLRRASLDTTLWARFCQPTLCVWARSPDDRAAITGLVAGAVTTASTWAALLGPERGAAGDYWRALFARTYAAELRVEKSGRPTDIVGNAPERYRQLLPLGWTAAGIGFEDADGVLTPRLAARERAVARRQWSRRARLGRPLNILRLLKAAFTFEGAMDYVAWKIERHRGVRISVTPWQRRHPLLAAPGLYWRLRRDGILR